MVEKIAADLECDEGKLNEDADNHTRKEMVVEDFLPAHHKSDTEMVISPTPPEASCGNQELSVTKLLVGTTQSSEERGTTLARRKRHLSCPPGRGPSVLS
ncbi:hypothetical protein A2U01_0072415, partial [Trifolium medium]|nr:hypothetical protein [Trifolium medium]